MDKGMRLVLISAAALLSACGSKDLAGTYRADFTSSAAPDVALAADLQQLALVFDGDQVTMEMSALGTTKVVPVDAHVEDDTVVLEQPQKWVLAIRDEHTLECCLLYTSDAADE